MAIVKKTRTPPPTLPTPLAPSAAIAPWKPTCRKCRGEGVPGATIQSVQLPGGLVTLLCIDCLNLWHRLLLTRPEFLAFERATRDASTPHAGTKRDQAEVRLMHTKAALFDLAAIWLRGEEIPPPAA